jgi:hypothetical protein
MKKLESLQKNLFESKKISNKKTQEIDSLNKKLNSLKNVNKKLLSRVTNMEKKFQEQDERKDELRINLKAMKNENLELQKELTKMKTKRRENEDSSEDFMYKNLSITTTDPIVSSIEQNREIEGQSDIVALINFKIDAIEKIKFLEKRMKEQNQILDQKLYVIENMKKSKAGNEKKLKNRIKYLKDQNITIEEESKKLYTQSQTWKTEIDLGKQIEENLQEQNKQLLLRISKLHKTILEKKNELEEEKLQRKILEKEKAKGIISMNEDNLGEPFFKLSDGVKERLKFFMEGEVETIFEQKFWRFLMFETEFDEFENEFEILMLQYEQKKGAKRRLNENQSEEEEEKKILLWNDYMYQRIQHKQEQKQEQQQQQRQYQYSSFTQPNLYQHQHIPNYDHHLYERQQYNPYAGDGHYQSQQLSPWGHPPQQQYLPQAHLDTQISSYPNYSTAEQLLNAKKKQNKYFSQQQQKKKGENIIRQEKQKKIMTTTMENKNIKILSAR